MEPIICDNCGCVITNDDPGYNPERPLPWRHSSLFLCHQAMRQRIAELEALARALQRMLDSADPYSTGEE
jgi:hypothetical protein